MKHFSITSTAICGALLFGALNVPTVRADEWDKKTTVTFSDPVQIPGMTLPAGSYIFKLLESPANRYVVQIFNDRESHIYATLEAIPNYRLVTPEKTRISFYEVPAGQAPALRAWFYPGDNYGRQFIYPKGEASLLAKAAHEAVPTGETTVATNESANTQATTQSNDQAANTEAKSTDSSATTESSASTETTVTEQPKTDENTTTESTTTETTVDQQPQPVQEPQPQPTTTTDDTSTTTLPSTASDWPLIGLIGLGSLASAFAVRKFAGRLS